VSPSRTTVASRLATAISRASPDRMPQRVVDVLEVVEVETEDCHLAIAPDTYQRILDAIAQQDAVGQIGQAVVARHVRDLRLGVAAVGDVLMRRHPTAARDRLIDQADDAAIAKLDDIPETSPRLTIPMRYSTYLLASSHGWRPPSTDARELSQRSSGFASSGGSP